MKTAFHRYISGLKAEISRYEKLSERTPLFQDDLDEKKARLKKVRFLQRMWENHPVVRQMTEIVEKTVKHYHGDFYYHDLLMLVNSGFKRFAWFVHGCGTHMVPLDGNEETVRNNQAWMKAVCDCYGSRGGLYTVDIDRMTLINGIRTFGRGNPKAARRTG